MSKARTMFLIETDDRHGKVALSGEAKYGQQEYGQLPGNQLCHVKSTT
jgi:hypothetical protein